MATTSVRPQYPLIVVVGPTASGKTALAIKLAQMHDGEIICADSRTVYRGMDIGTAKPTVTERAGIPHWGIDLVDPGERFTVADFKEYADAAIQDITARDKVPIIVGGTGLYVDAVVYDFQFRDGYNNDLRESMGKLTVEQLHDHCRENNIVISPEQKNKRRIIREIEASEYTNSSRSQLRAHTIVVGIATKKLMLDQRIEQRAEQIFQDKVVDEAIKLGKKYGWDGEAMTGNIYPIIHEYAQGLIAIDEARRRFVISDRQLAKRQMTWFRRNPDILWGTAEDLPDYLDTIITRI